MRTFLRKCIPSLLALAFLVTEVSSLSLCLPSTAYATSTDTSDTDSTDTDTSETETSSEPTLQILDTDQVSTEDILLYSTACVVMDIDSGAILYSKNGTDQLYPASTTKLLTALIALENTELTDVITFSEEAINSIEWDYANMELNAGDQLTMEEALYGILLVSANEAAYGIAEYVSGSLEAFVEEMNEYALSLGCYHTNFTNATGIHDDNHYTTAEDLALIARAAGQNEELVKIMGSSYYTIENINYKSTEVETTDEDGNTTVETVAEAYTLYNHHKMINGIYTYEGCYGGKTGYTSAAGNTLVTYVERDDMNLVCVILGCSYGYTYAYEDTMTALDYCFENYETLTAEYNAAQELLDYPEMILSNWYTLNTASADSFTEISDYLNSYPFLYQSTAIYLQYTGVKLSKISDFKGVTSVSSSGSSSTSSSEGSADLSDPVSFISGQSTRILFVIIAALLIVFLTFFLYYLVRAIRRKRRRRNFEEMRRQRLSETQPNLQNGQSVSGSGEDQKDSMNP